jgi:hypothetical protein
VYPAQIHCGVKLAFCWKCTGHLPRYGIGTGVWGYEWEELYLYAINMTACYRLTEINRYGPHWLWMICIAGLLRARWWTAGFHSRRRVPVVRYYVCTVCPRHGISFTHGARGAKMQLIVSLPVTHLYRCMQGRSCPNRIWKLMTCRWSNRPTQGPNLNPLNCRTILTNMIYIYICLTAIGLTPGDSSTSHIYTQTVHIIQRKEIWEVRAVPIFASYTLVFALQLREKNWKPQLG